MTAVTVSPKFSPSSWLRCLLAMALFLGLGLPVFAADRVALVIGNASYEVGRLANPVNDATDVAAALRAKGFAVTLATNVSRGNLLEQVEAFRSKIRPGGIALVFFAGHAVEHRGENWLLPVENGAIRTQAHVSIHSVSAQDVLSAIEERGARLNVLVLDACRDNPLPAGARSAQRGLAVITTGTSSLVAFATSPGRTAADGHGRNSPYTAALLSGLRDPSLSVTQLFNKVGAEVVQTTGGAQVPWNSNTPIWPEVYLAGEASGPIEVEPAQPPPSIAPIQPQAQSVAPISAAKAPAALFHDRLGSGGEGPAMIALPASWWLPVTSFVMGSPESESARYSDEGPTRSVRVSAFAMGQTEVTFAEWDVCVERGGCGHRPSDGGWGRGDRPVMNVSWEDAQQYTAWLSRETGHEYRLPSESEWEYAARAGTTSAYWWGDGIGHNRANCYGCGSAWGDSEMVRARSFLAKLSGLSALESRQTAPVRSFVANPWGLYEVHGNVSEWTQDCWNQSYAGAPTDGSAWQTGDCGRRVIRGGSWHGQPAGLRSAFRSGFTPTNRSRSIGFRLARAM